MALSSSLDLKRVAALAIGQRFNGLVTFAVKNLERPSLQGQLIICLDRLKEDTPASPSMATPTWEADMGWISVVIVHLTECSHS
jgi:hypothetical protein